MSFFHRLIGIRPWFAFTGNVAAMGGGASTAGQPIGLLLILTKAS